MKKINFKIRGMHCASCALNIENALQDTAGVETANVNYALTEAAVEFDEQVITESGIHK
ncbi:cation transporter, partial [Patescibacteria group bacterium]|nr:cation transporter [Patescibacteria group bacterium]